MSKCGWGPCGDEAKGGGDYCGPTCRQRAKRARDREGDGGVTRVTRVTRRAVTASTTVAPEVDGGPVADDADDLSHLISIGRTLSHDEAAEVNAVRDTEPVTRDTEPVTQAIPPMGKPTWKDPLGRPDKVHLAGMTAKQAYLEGLKDGTARLGWPEGQRDREPGDDPDPEGELGRALQDVRAVLALYASNANASARAEAMSEAAQAAVIRLEESAIEAERIVERLGLCLQTTELGVRAVGLHPGYGPPREARSRYQREETIEHQEGSTDDVDFDPLAGLHLPPDDEPDPASDIAAATRGI